MIQRTRMSDYVKGRVLNYCFSLLGKTQHKESSRGVCLMCKFFNLRAVCERLAK